MEENPPGTSDQYDLLWLIGALAEAAIQAGSENLLPPRLAPIVDQCVDQFDRRRYTVATPIDRRLRGNQIGGVTHEAVAATLTASQRKVLAVVVHNAAVPVGATRAWVAAGQAGRQAGVSYDVAYSAISSLEKRGLLLRGPRRFHVDSIDHPVIVWRPTGIGKAINTILEQMEAKSRG